MDRIGEMALFARVVQAGSFSAAARELDRTPSAVSKQIRRLEDRLGVRLLHRTTRRLSLSEAGRTLYQHARQAVAAAQAGEEAVARLQERPRGVLTVNAPVSFGSLHLAPVISDFLARYPEVSVDMTVDDRVLDLVESGFDVAVRIAELPDSSLIARRLAPARHVVCAAPAYLARFGEPRTPADLARHNGLTYAYSRQGPEWPFDGPGGPETVRVGGNLQVNHGDGLRAAAVAGLGIALLPTFIAGDDLRAGRLRPLLPGYRTRELSIYAVYPERRHLPAKVRAFVDFLVETFAGQPYWDRGLF
ncbi:MAG TPA: LysR family transcriptional regulator [Gammaproteobacteria bacterium]|nr:LysR family transcriptional regulator [Gammaproteobacteria bacterium]